MNDDAQPDRDKVLALLLQTLKVMENARESERETFLWSVDHLANWKNNIYSKALTIHPATNVSQGQVSVQSGASLARLVEIQEQTKLPEEAIVKEIEARSELLTAIRNKLTGRNKT